MKQLVLFVAAVELRSGAQHVSSMQVLEGLNRSCD